MSITPSARELSTKRLVLEPLRIDHAAEMVPVLADSELYHFTGGEAPTLEQLTRRYTLLCAGSGDPTEQWHNWIVRLADTQRAIGYMQATVESTEVTVAWLIGIDWQGQGYAKEAARAMTDWLAAHGARGLTAWIHPDHVGSHGIARSLQMTPTNDIDEDGEARWIL